MIVLKRVDWLAPSNVKAVQTKRQGGVSKGAFASLNLGAHVTDSPQNVTLNRTRLADQLAIPADSLRWLNQTHSTIVVEDPAAAVEADASFTRKSGVVCAVMTADCLPVLFCDEAGTQVAAAHCGWRGLAGGILEKTVHQFASPGSLMAWLGPAIGPDHFEVGVDVVQAFTRLSKDLAGYFSPAQGTTRGVSKWMGDLYGIARHLLTRQGVTQIFGGGDCTFCQSNEYFSFRRESVTGRQASLIWLSETLT